MGKTWWILKKLVRLSGSSMRDCIALNAPPIWMDTRLFWMTSIFPNFLKRREDIRWRNNKTGDSRCERLYAGWKNSRPWWHSHRIIENTSVWITDYFIGVILWILQEWSPSHIYEGCPNHTASKTWITKYKMWNMRPISLLNSVIKVSCKVLARRLEGQLPQLVGGNQNGFIRGRQGFHDVRRELNILQSQREAKDTAWFTWRPSTESVSLMEVLTRFGFGDRFCKWVRLLCTGLTAQVWTNTVVSKEAAHKEALCPHYCLFLQQNHLP